MSRLPIGIIVLTFCFLCPVMLSAAAPEVEQARRYGAEGQITLRVVDSTGKPVDNATLSVAFWGSDSSANVVVSEGTTDTNGLFLATGKTIHSMNYTITKEGYYTSRGAYWFYRPSGLDPNKRSAISPTSGEYWMYHQEENSVKSGRWHPWNPTNTVVLKEHRNPAPMYAQKVDALIPVQDKGIGFDLEKGDWVAPLGQGNTADLVLEYRGVYEGPQVYTKRLVITFSNEKDGFQSFPFDSASVFRTMYAAPEDGYDPLFLQERARTRMRIMKSEELGKNQYLVIRTRTVTDKEGNIVSARYGKLYGPIEYGRTGKVEDNQGGVRFTYYFNPTPNDRNLEFDPSRNLFNWKSGAPERVSAP